MNYPFPYITHLNDVLPAIKDSKEFIVVKKDGYTVINYLVSTDGTFPDVDTVVITNGKDFSPPMYVDDASRYAAIRRECRGIIFDEYGDILSRRYHKFFNLYEREETHATKIDFSDAHTILVKEDGSMISPIVFEGGIVRWCSKMGITDTSMETEVFVSKNSNYVEFAKYIHELQSTPIFEWVSRKNRIVLDYPEDNLILTAIRTNILGEYATYHQMKEAAEKYNIPVVRAYESEKISDIGSFVENLSKKENIEGVVVRFDNGHMIKIKTEWYVKIHRAKDILSRENDVAQIILDDKIDDILPLLPEEEKDKVLKFRDALTERLLYISNTAWNLLTDCKEQFSRKEFAIGPAKKIDGLLRSVIFKNWDNPGYDQVVKDVTEYLKKHCNKKTNYEDLKITILKGIEL